MNMIAPKIEPYASGDDFSDLQILVVEDSISARQKIVTSLKELGVKIWEADDGSRALEIITQNPEQIDLVLTDLHMEKINGDDLCREIRTRLKLSSLPVIILSADKDKKTTISLFDAGATDYLYKPFANEELFARIKVHLKQEKMKKLLQKTIFELQALNRMKDDFLAVCSHDLKTPLSGILGYTDILMSEIENPEHLEMLQDMNSAGENLLSMIHDILDLSRAEAARTQMAMTCLKPADVIAGCIRSLEPAAAAKHIQLSLFDHASQTQIMGNESALGRIFNNLLSNAVKFTPESGQISVSLKLLDENTLSVSVMDSGIGIPKDKIDALFNRYSTFSRLGTAGERSTGLGLSIAKELIGHHHGTISVKSREGKGTVFKITFPVHSVRY